MESKEINICFSELIQKKGWYIRTTQDRKLASKHKNLFLSGQLNAKKIREYLLNAGYECVQPELWKIKE